MYKLTLPIVFLFISLGATAQIQIGIINFEEALLKFDEFKEANDRYNQLKESYEDQLEKNNEMVIKMEKEVNEYEGDKKSEEYMQLNYKVRTAIKNNEATYFKYQRELDKRVQELLVPLRLSFAAVIEQIALEEGLGIVLHSERISEDLIKYIGEKKLIDIAELVIERANEN